MLGGRHPRRGNVANAEGLRERKKQKTRDLLIGTALKLFLEKGYEETSIEEIAAAAEVSPRTFFRYFPNKEDVVFLDQDKEDAFLREMIETRDPTLDKLTLLHQATLRIFTMSGHNFAHNPQIFALVVKTPSLLNKALRIVVSATNQIADGLVEDKTNIEEVRYARILSATFMGGLLASILDWVSRGMREDPKELLDEFMTLLKNGFQPPEKKKR
jgi:AcrR family transcriptional regulator